MFGTRVARGWAAAALAAVMTALGAAGCSGQGDGGRPDVGGRPGGGGTLQVRLVAFDSCDQALGELKAAAGKQVGPYGLPGQGGVPLAASADGARDSASGAEAESGVSAAMPAPPATKDYSTTNTHEAGVDEPDLVKSDGRRLVVVADDYLRVIDVADRRETGRLRLPGASAGQLLVDGDRALVVLPWQNQRWIPGSQPGGGSPGKSVSEPAPPVPADRGGVAPSMPMPVPGEQGSRLALIDLTGEPEIIGTLDIEGSYVDAREVGGVARVVMSSRPHLPFVYPDDKRSESDALRENRRVIQRSSIDDWLPRYELDSGGVRRDGVLTDCDQVRHPQRYSGSAALSVLTIPMGKPLGDGEAVSVFADGETVYGTTESLYIAHNDWDRVTAPLGKPVPGGRADAPVESAEMSTEVHQFDISGSGRPEYVASGAVPGQLLNQYSLSEHDGHLRVATTMTSRAESVVTVLASRGERLVEVGKVGGLGKGERIFAVRFLGPVGYVVTFRQTDPLYTLDLSDPARPETAGELKITGYSAYLHPAGEGRLIGVGQEATDQGSVLGTQVSLFDVSDPARPRRIAQHHLRDGWSEVESDPHAFLFWPATGLTVLPVAKLAEPGALVLQQRDAKFAELGMVRHPASAASSVDYGRGGVRRALVVGDELWTVSAAGVMASDTARLTERAWIPFE
jgi:uncharacterized secreted protein with C-terminal beta-propeller domain